MSTLAMPSKEPIPYRVWKKVDEDPDLLQLVDAVLCFQKRLVGFKQQKNKEVMFLHFGSHVEARGY